MNSEKTSLELDYSTNLVRMTFLCDLPDADVRACLIKAFGEIPYAYQFDWLFDFTILSKPISAETAMETASEWQRIAQGRDVGRRSAVISGDARYQALIDKAQQTMPYRSLSFFDTVEDGVNWLQSLGDANQEGTQLI